MPISKALLIADPDVYRNAEVIDLMHRAGFEVHLLSSSRYPKSYPNLHKFIYVSKPELIPKVAINIFLDYKLVIAVGDIGINLIKNSSLSEIEKVKLLPITKKSSLKHLASKIGLSQVFFKHHISSPVFAIVKTKRELYHKINNIGLPALLKIDFSGGGFGVFKLNCMADIKLIPQHFFNHPLLLQKFIQGRLIDLSAFFLHTQLIHFSYSESLKTIHGPFGPSSLRRYFGYGLVDRRISSELSQIGKALGAHGFVNIGCIETKNNKRYYFEADMRPNAWINYPRFIHNDLAIKIKHYFLNHQSPDELFDKKRLDKKTYIFPYPSRLHWKAIITNQYDCLKYINYSHMILNALDKLIHYPYTNHLKVMAVIHLKPLLPNKLWQALKNISLL